MSIEDFDKINTNLDNDKKSKKVDDYIKNNMDLKSIQYYMNNMDELVSCLNKSYCDMINSKLKHDFKMDTLQTSIDWGEENILREANHLPKVTTQKQRDSVINLKVKDMKIHMEACEFKYKFYSKLFNFISKNFELLDEYYQKVCDCDKISEDVNENSEDSEN